MAEQAKQITELGGRAKVAEDRPARRRGARGDKGAGADRCARGAQGGTAHLRAGAEARDAGDKAQRAAGAFKRVCAAVMLY